MIFVSANKDVVWCLDSLTTRHGWDSSDLQVWNHSKLVRLFAINTSIYGKRSDFEVWFDNECSAELLIEGKVSHA